MKMFVTGCTHFGHKRIIEYCNRPFRDIEEHDEYLIEAWNDVVSEGDRVYHLGDFTFNWRNRDQIIERLNGDIQFVLGNHDRASWGWPDERYFSAEWPDGRKRYFSMSHYPDKGDKHPHVEAGSYVPIHLHAHTHKTEFITTLGNPIRVHVGVDATPNYAPVNVLEIPNMVQWCIDNHETEIRGNWK